MKNKPKVGDVVHLNLDGIESIYGTTLGLRHLMTKKLVITNVDDESITYPENTWVVQVDDSEINMFFLSNWNFDYFIDTSSMIVDF